jgi:hypothetical protein
LKNYTVAPEYPTRGTSSKKNKKKKKRGNKSPRYQKTETPHPLSAVRFVVRKGKRKRVRNANS